MRLIPGQPPFFAVLKYLAFQVLLSPSGAGVKREIGESAFGRIKPMLPPQR